MTSYAQGYAASPARDMASPAGDAASSPNFGMCDTTRLYHSFLLVMHIQKITERESSK